MPPYDPRAFIKLMFWSISFLLICTYLFGSEVSTKDKVIEVLAIAPKDVDNMWPLVEFQIKEAAENEDFAESTLVSLNTRTGVVPVGILPVVNLTVPPDVVL